MSERKFRDASRTPAPASTGSQPSSFSTSTHAPERAPEAREWKRGERCRTAEERAAKKAYFYARKLTLQRARRAASPRVDYTPSAEVWEAVNARRESGATLSEILNALVLLGVELGNDDPAGTQRFDDDSLRKHPGEDVGGVYKDLTRLGAIVQA